MKIISWNLNGIRSFKNGVKEVIDSLAADVICLQEIKASRSSLEDSIINVPGYSSYFSLPKYLSGYSGVATFCRNDVRPVSAEEGLSGTLIPAVNLSDAVGSWPDLSDQSEVEIKALESEGRAVITRHTIQFKNESKDVVIINVYCPCVDCTRPERAAFQLNFYKLLEKRATELYKNGCCVIILGDLNVARHPVDHCDPGNATEFSQRSSRVWLNNFLQPVESTDKGDASEANFIDTFRYFYPDKKQAYTCWNTLTGARKTNYGTRIDYVLIDKSSIDLLEDVFILAEFEGSDHCPVGVTIKCRSIAALKCPSICSKYWPEFAGKQKKLTAFLKSKEELEIVQTVKRQKCEMRPKQTSITGFLSKTKKADAVATKKNDVVTYLSNDDEVSGLSSKTWKVNNLISRKINVMSCSHDDRAEKPLGFLNKRTEAIVSSQNGGVTNCGNDDENQCASWGSRNDETIIENREEKSLTNNQLNTRVNGSKVTQASAWKMILKGPPKPPKCSAHQEVCLIRTVQKEGPNYGRQFFVCSRPMGDKNNKEARCDYFKWTVETKQKLSS